ncbi:6-bladed beta-propeller [Mongoliitalea daihaiensis]|uniref:6-bladed beta-propeller n=1 Tax=Mongoliitalea daihaiensis TaxID=2782006 RepID=UPI001F1A6D13|nr:6-bladed beta-propeller [Mongoliitalea daihaiensis]UJP66823.1 6-bladed beta-propeller [Mongoliitalea daihaiensis]
MDSVGEPLIFFARNLLAAGKYTDEHGLSIAANKYNWEKELFGRWSIRFFFFFIVDVKNRCSFLLGLSVFKEKFMSGVITSKIVCYVIIVLVFFSCRPTIDEAVDESENIYHFKKGSLDIRTVVDKPTYIKLNQSEGYFITEVDKLHITDKFIYVLDLAGSHHVYVFTLDGDFVTRIGTIGDGPEEYRRLADFFVNEQEQVVLLDRQRKRLFTYTFQGELLSIKSINFRADSFIEIDGGYLFGLVVESENELTDGFHVVKTDNDLNIVEKYQQYPKGFMDVKFHTGLFTKSQDFIYYHKPVTDHVLKFDSKGNLVSLIPLSLSNPKDFDDYKKDYAALAEKRSSKDFNYLNSPPHVLGDIVLAQGYSGNTKVMFLYDQKNKSSGQLSINPLTFNHLNVNFPLFTKDDAFVASVLDKEMFLADKGKSEVPKDVVNHLSDGGVTVLIYPLLKK